MTDRGNGQRGLLLTAAHVVNGNSDRRKRLQKVRIDFRTKSGMVTQWASAVAWPLRWRSMDIAAVELLESPRTIDPMTLKEVERGTEEDVQVYGYDMYDDDDEPSVLQRVDLGVKRIGSWLIYNKDRDLDGWSGGPVTHPGGVEVCGVHVGERRAGRGACAINMNIIRELEEELWG